MTEELRQEHLRRIENKLEETEATLRATLASQLADIRTALNTLRHSAQHDQRLLHSPEAKEKKETGAWTQKEFVHRNSLLTDLFQMYNIRAVYNIFLAILLLLIINTLVHDLWEHGSLGLPFDMIGWGFGYFPLTIFTWISMWLSTVVIVYPAFQYWATQVTSTSALTNGFWLFLYLAYLWAFFFLPMLVMIHNPLPIASASIISCEQTRIAMVIHAFIRENLGKAMAWKRMASHRLNDGATFIFWLRLKQ